ncbi:MAG: DNA cytosine methyltransferase [Candidatus Thiodiazotropha sp. (ex Codakia orbicularis)]|nr:DNA cytosine methyltransferase [Candidatus Thiodiazotropha sp. (ex Codakia orbicularis)]
MRSIELFAGGGGLGLGLSIAGFKHEAVIERDKWSCDTIRQNIKNNFPHVKDWKICEIDARAFDYSSISSEIDLVSGGPPCQPFSLAGKHKANKDHRDMFPVAIDVVKTLKPKAFIFENVKGISRSSFINYFQYIVLQLSFPEITIKEDENWKSHLARLEKQKTRNLFSGLSYNVIARDINAVDYGIPQQRHRVFIVGFRSDQNQGWCFPNPTHSLDSLIHSQWVTNDYWDRHYISKQEIPEISSRIQRRLKKLSVANSPLQLDLKPWKTVRDAFIGLPDPIICSSSKKFSNHIYQPGAKTYKGHTGSPLDLPSKTLKAGSHGVPGGENMIAFTNGNVRYFTVRESARLQTFPDTYLFHGSWSETMRQLGNAVPVELARIFGLSIKRALTQ